MSFAAVEATTQCNIVKEYSSYLYIALSCVLIVLWLYWLWSQRHIYRFAWTLPTVFGYPFFGVLLHMKGSHNTLPYFRTLYNKYKTYTVQIWVGIQPTILTSDPDFIKFILSSPKMLNKSRLYSVLSDGLGNGLISSPSSEWQIHRKMINPSFNHQVLLTFFSIFNSAKNTVINELKEMADDNKLYGLTELFLKTSIEISFETVLGKPPKGKNQIKKSIIKHFIFLVYKSTFKCVLTYMNLDFLYVLYRKYANARTTCIKFVLELLTEKISKVNSGEEDVLIERCNNDDNLEGIQKKPQIFVDQVLQIYKRNEFNLQDVMAEANHVLAASFETTAINMFSTLVLIAMHPLVQERLYEEIINAFPDKDFCMEQQHMDQLPYLEMVIKEALRVFPPVPLIGRRVTEETKTSDNVSLPKGLDIAICIYHLHRHPDIWGPNADKFDPEHFLPDLERDRHKFAYIPFSGGSRNCIGWQYALFLAKTLIAGIIRNYRLETDTKYNEIELELTITLKFKKEPLIRVYRR